MLAAKVTLGIFLSERWPIQPAFTAGRAKAHPSYRVEASHDVRTCQRVELRTRSDDIGPRPWAAAIKAVITLNAEGRQRLLESLRATRSLQWIP